MSPASGNALPPNNAGKITQIIKTINSLHGQKPVMLRIKIDYATNGTPVTDTADVTFPATV